MNRYYSLVCYLNDDFEGGSTRFPALDYAVKPQCGKAILFPSRYLHGGEPVISGQKYILISWITGPIPKD
jgi:predicted 2-oxoglutarate/Fe(II)-dependent dioxygenase YbiX